MTYNGKWKFESETAVCLALFVVILPSAAWLLFAATVWPSGRLALALLCPVGIALPTLLYLRLRSEATRLQETICAEQAAAGRLLLILEATPDLVAMSDMEGKICYFNRAGRQMVGMKEVESTPNVPGEASSPGFGVSLLRRRNRKRRTQARHEVSLPVFDPSLLPADVDVAAVTEQLFPIGIENGFWQGEKNCVCPMAASFLCPRS